MMAGTGQRIRLCIQRESVRRHIMSYKLFLIRKRRRSILLQRKLEQIKQEPHSSLMPKAPMFTPKTGL